MIKLVLLLLIALCCCAFADRSVIVNNLGDQAVRSYSVIVSAASNTFTASGRAVFSSLFGGGAKAKTDGSIFYFNGQRCTYTYVHKTFDAIINGDNGTISKSETFAAVFSPFIIIEYEETNGVEGYQYGNDTLLGWARNDKWDATDYWKFSVTKANFTTTTPDNQSIPFTVTTVNATSPNGLFSLSFSISDAPVSVNDTDITADQTKINIEIKGYYDNNVNPATKNCDVKPGNFACQSTGASNNNNSRLALGSFVGVGTANALFRSSPHGFLKTHGGGNVDAVFDWATTVSINGANATANVSTSFSDFKKGEGHLNPDVNVDGDSNNIGAQIMVHSFDYIRPQSIYWDPTFGGQSTGSIALPSIILIVSTIFAMLML
ncbi:hypothetical protein SAMD00019534_006260 [Acytostelium subglobosum LB1]|uniref:hypothetical protein n=1 Tax=Acytostelium subglobosum LB1 TaxID=1410327 RepID=UPI00064483FB|nr:hypothetical protein SAMD00019534_006260 [Acytostelium subglobosum LB1]GAM17451.1 hypothetical protein SAMD00019534_006260 [Acytostelium subglobosum LB1]|eukprot:XP_012759513.1 hypothetical protein SAMD00019534_006260 [Acytostelium subglobosum LB1]